MLLPCVNRGGECEESVHIHLSCSGFARSCSALRYSCWLVRINDIDTTRLLLHNDNDII